MGIKSKRIAETMKQWRKHSYRVYLPKRATPEEKMWRDYCSDKSQEIYKYKGYQSNRNNQSYSLVTVR